MRKILAYFGLVKRSDIIDLLELVDNIRIYEYMDNYHINKFLRVRKYLLKILKC